jgi:ABC-2 type transport system permease protein
MMIIMMASVLIISSEFTHNTFNELLELSKKRISVIILGKSFPHIVIHIINLLILLGLIFPFFNVAQPQSEMILILFSIFFAIVVFFFGFMISTIFHNQMFATELALFILTPAFILSGITFPLWAMPAVFKFLAMLIPYTYFLAGFIKAINLNSPLFYMSNEITALFIFLILSLIVTIIGLRFQVKESSVNCHRSALK